MDDIARYVAQRNEVLLNLDIAGFRRLAKVPYATPDLVCEIGLHKARIEVTTMPSDKIAESVKWLLDHGYTDMFGNAPTTEGRHANP